MAIIKMFGLLFLLTVEIRGFGNNCKNPDGDHGETRTEGYLKETCMSGIWRPNLEDLERRFDELKMMFKDHIAQSGCTKKSPGQSPTVEGILISGGQGTGSGGLTVDIVESQTDLYIPSTNKTCSLPPLPGRRWAHSMDVVKNTPIICGGTQRQYNIDGVTGSNCLHFTPTSTSGVWTDYATMKCPRSYHSSWVTKESLVVLGGGNCFGAEVVPSGEGYGFKGSNKAYACTIDDVRTESTIITGGLNSKEIVERHNIKGRVETLPNLITGRWGHGCGSYIVTDGVMVLIVAGGSDVRYKDLSTTEKISIGGTAWTMANPLPNVLSRMGSVSMSNTIYFIGGETTEPTAEILTFDGEDWNVFGQLPSARKNHAVVKVDTAAFMGFCK